MAIFCSHDKVLCDTGFIFVHRLLPNYSAHWVGDSPYAVIFEFQNVGWVNIEAVVLHADYDE